MTDLARKLAQADHRLRSSCASHLPVPWQTGPDRTSSLAMPTPAVCGLMKSN